MKVTIHVNAGNNEEIIVESELKSPQDWDSRVLPVFEKLEARVGDRARRLMAANEQLRALTAEHPEQGNLVANLVLLCLGRLPQVMPHGLTDQPNSVPSLVKREDG